MIYRSNLICPDLKVSFRHIVSRPMPHSFGHDVPSDWGDKADDDPHFGLYKRCGFWTHDEAAILYSVVREVVLRGHGRHWLDIGSHTGWTAAHAAAAGGFIHCVDPMLRLEVWQDRFESNLSNFWSHIDSVDHVTSQEFFRRTRGSILQFAGVTVDGDHEPGEPLKDARGALESGAQVIIFHDALGLPVREAAVWLMDQGMKARFYETAHGVIVAWRGDFTPPDHTPDVGLPDLKARCEEFDFSRCS